MKKKATKQPNDQWKNRWNAEYEHEPLKTYKEMIRLGYEGINRYVTQEVIKKGRTYQSVGDELGMTKSNVERIVKEQKQKTIAKMERKSKG